MKLKKYSNMILSAIILVLMIILQIATLNLNSSYCLSILILIINPILSALLGIIISKHEKLTWTLACLLIIILFSYKESFGFFDKNVLIYSVTCLAIALLFMITKTSNKIKFKSLAILSLISILQFIMVSSIDFESMETMLSILILAINPILSILLGIIVLKEKKLFWILTAIVLIPVSTYKILFKEMELNIIFIYSIIYLILAFSIILCNTIIKKEKLSLILSIILAIILIVTTIIETYNRNTIKNIKLGIKEWYSNYEGTISKINEKDLLIKIEYYEEYIDGFTTLNTRFKLDVTQLKVGDIVQIPEDFDYDYFYWAKKIKVIEKDDDDKYIKIGVYGYKTRKINKKEIRLITDNYGKKLKYNEIEINQDIKVLLKRETLKVNLSY